LVPRADRDGKAAGARQSQKAAGDERAHEDFVGSHVGFGRSGARAELGRFFGGVRIVDDLHVHIVEEREREREEVRIADLHEESR